MDARTSLGAFDAMLDDSGPEIEHAVTAVFCKFAGTSARHVGSVKSGRVYLFFCGPVLSC